VISMREERIAQGLEDARLIAAEVVGENQVQRGPGLRLVLVVPVRIVPTSAVFYLLRGQAEKEEIFLSAPFIMNFMLLVPLASYPAVEI
jgi:hypothetical protein